MLTHIGGMLGFLAQAMTFRFLTPVYIGDTVTCTVTIREKIEAKRLVLASATFVNQDGTEVVYAEFEGFPGHIRLAQ